MSDAGGKFNDLTARFLSAVVMVMVGGAALWAGGVWFLILIAVSAGVMIWETLRMADPGRGELDAMAQGVLAAAAMGLAWNLSTPWNLVFLGAPALLTVGMALGNRWLLAGFALYIMVAAFGFVALRAGGGLVWALWLIGVVVVSDVAGYFAGRLIGGPKLWPRVSPKKTWSGTVAGWIGCAALGAAFMQDTGAGPALIALSVVAAMAAQAGDIVESALKRKAGVKDASNLIPGHGGVFDRFDGMLGASLLVMILGAVTGFPPGFAAP